MCVCGGGGGGGGGGGDREREREKREDIEEKSEQKGAEEKQASTTWIFYRVHVIGSLMGTECMIGLVMAIPTYGQCGYYLWGRGGV